MCSCSLQPWRGKRLSPSTDCSGARTYTCSCDGVARHLGPVGTAKGMSMETPSQQQTYSMVYFYHVSFLTWRFLLCCCYCKWQFWDAVFSYYQDLQGLDIFVDGGIYQNNSSIDKRQKYSCFKAIQMTYSWSWTTVGLFYVGLARTSHLESPILLQNTMFPPVPKAWGAAAGSSSPAKRSPDAM